MANTVEEECQQLRDTYALEQQGAGPAPHRSPTSLGGKARALSSSISPKPSCGGDDPRVPRSARRLTVAHQGRRDELGARRFSCSRGSSPTLRASSARTRTPTSARVGVVRAAHPDAKHAGDQPRSVRAHHSRSGARDDGAAGARLRRRRRGITPGKDREEIAARCGICGRAHALEEQSIALLSGARISPVTPSSSGSTASTSRSPARRSDRRPPRGVGASSTLKDAALLSAASTGRVLPAQPDTPGKLAAFVYAVEHLEIAGYELLRRVARRVDDAYDRPLRPHPRAGAGMAERVAGAFDRALRSVAGRRGDRRSLALDPARYSGSPAPGCDRRSRTGAARSCAT